MFFIFLKRYLKTSLFFLCILSAVVLSSLYENLDLSRVNSLNIGVFIDFNDENAAILKDNLIQKSSYFNYKPYESLDMMKKDIENEKLNYGLLIDLKKDRPFTIYGFDSKFVDIAKEDIYSEYFKLSAQNYTQKLLNLNKKDYDLKYEKYIKGTFSFEYMDKNISKVFPIAEISSFILYILSLIICYDYFSLCEKSNFFDTFRGRKSKEKFIISGIIINAMVYYIILKIFSQVGEFNYIIYNVLLILNSIAFIRIFEKRYFMIFMPFLIILSMISIVIMGLNGKFSNISLIFLNNVYIKSYIEFIPMFIYGIILIFINMFFYLRDRYFNFI